MFRVGGTRRVAAPDLSLARSFSAFNPVLGYPELAMEALLQVFQGLCPAVAVRGGGGGA